MIGIDLRGKTILITGALGAIAEHMVRKLCEAGATLALTDIKDGGSGPSHAGPVEDCAGVIFVFCSGCYRCGRRRAAH